MLQIKKEERKLEIIVGELEKHYNDNWRKNNLHIDEDSRVAIRLLKEVSVQLPLIKGALRKVAYEVYYKRAVDELIKGVAGKCGIYRIVHIESGRIYVGQSVDIGERWKQHIKRVLGIEVSTMNKLYP